MNFKSALSYILIFSVLIIMSCQDDRSGDPVGTWTKSSTQTEGQVLGTLELKESSLFVFTAKEEGHTNTDGRYSLSNNQITFEDDTCFNTATYSYDVSETKLIFTIISDHCTERVKILEGTWYRSK